jgi:hypothetical protein
MTIGRRIVFQLFALVSLACGILLTVVGGNAQDKTLHAGEEQPNLVLDNDWSKDDKELKAFQAYRRGDAGAQVPAEVLDHAAQWYAYRFTNEQFYKDVKPGAKGMHDLMKDALDQVVDPRDSAKKPTEAQLQFKEEFDKRFVKSLVRVAKNPKPVVRVNGVMVLGKLAATGSEDATVALMDVIKDPKENDGIKLHAFRGIRDFFALGRGDNANPFRKKERESQCIAALLEYLNRPSGLSENAPADEKAALHYIRKDAIAALAETRYPGVLKTENKKAIIERPTALMLLRIMRKEGMTPPPSVEEQVNAAAGLCRLKSRSLDQYHVDYAAHQIGQFVVEFITVHNSGQVKVASWKVLANRLARALEELKSDVEGRQGAKYVTAMAAQVDELLKPMIESKADVRPSPEKLAVWLEQNKPAASNLYDGTPEALTRAAPSDDQ